MPKFYFNVHTPVQQVTDFVGEECESAEEATAWARREASDLVFACLWRGDATSTGWIEVADEYRRPVLVLPLKQLA